MAKDLIIKNSIEEFITFKLQKKITDWKNSPNSKIMESEEKIL